jgi:lipopolysaccharide/colanic/teichoic acid biosynthesis glycosyltransferase
MSPPTTTAAVEASPSHDFSVAPPVAVSSHPLPADVADGTDVLRALDVTAKRLLDIAAAVVLLIVCLPLFLIVAALIKLDSRGPLFYGCRRVGRDGRELRVLKFRKMRDGAGGPALTLDEDERFTRIGPFLAATKIDELPQLINVLRGDMSLVGPRPEDAGFVDLQRESYDRILRVKPGMTGLTQLAFANEREILDRDDALGHYVERLLPQKVRIDTLYATRRSTVMDLRILLWTAVAVLLRREVAVNRESARITLRRRTTGSSALPAVASGDRRRA